MSMRKKALGFAALAGASAALFGGPSPSAQATTAAPPLVEIFPQHVPQADGLRMALTAGLPSVPGATGIKVTQEPDLSLQRQKWELRFAPGGAVLQLVNVHTGLCLKGGGVAGNVVRQVTCVPSASTAEPRQFWRDRQTLLNGVVVHRYENVDNGLYMGIRASSPQSGALLESQALNSLPSQKFKLKAVS
ncbi:RICIN domain-containing protein [Planomonospora sp. ID67723]|uniref:RICIN domain-containing protein n=1 Tax=Planomonospora sp. ID67723 TaxID=2738134 RepID=UPI0018C3F504|nr:RICIN domain-containing protein [Planomonospora sp. ID67723]MBG0829665.1 RICIN domain-containing protein [Planomonospora sp. ID67723]